MSSRRLPLLLLFLLASLPLQAQAPLPSGELDALIARSGVTGEIEELARQFEAAILGSASDFDPKQVARMREAVAQAFAADKIRGAIRVSFQEIPREDFEVVARWYASPLGARIQEVEEKASGPEGQARLQDAGAQGELAKIVGAERLKRIEGLDHAQGTTEAIFLWLQHTTGSVARIKLLLWGVDPAVAADKTEKIAQMKPMLRRGSLLAQASAYRELTDEELDRYLAYSESPAGRRWHAARTAALDRIFTAGMKEVAGRLAAAPK